MFNCKKILYQYVFWSFTDCLHDINFNSGKMRTWLLLGLEQKEV